MLSGVLVDITISSEVAVECAELQDGAEKRGWATTLLPCHYRPPKVIYETQVS